MVMRELIFHPLFCIVLINGSYLVCLCARASFGNMSWQYVNSINWIVWLGDGSIGVCVWFGAPIMHIMSGLSLAWHWHFLSEHVLARSQSGTVSSGGWLLWLHALVNVKNMMFLLACSIWVIKWTTLLCFVILSPFKYKCSHVDSRWGHVSLSLLLHSVQLGFWYERGQNMFFLWVPMYCAYLNFIVWVICVSGTCLLFQK